MALGEHVFTSIRPCTSSTVDWFLLLGASAGGFPAQSTRWQRQIIQSSVCSQAFKDAAQHKGMQG